MGISSKKGYIQYLQIYIQYTRIYLEYRYISSKQGFIQNTEVYPVYRDISSIYGYSSTKGYIQLLTINFKTSAKCRLQLESPLGDSQTKFSARNSLCTPPHGASNIFVIVKSLKLSKIFS